MGTLNNIWKTNGVKEVGKIIKHIISDHRKRRKAWQYIQSWCILYKDNLRIHYALKYCVLISFILKVPKSKYETFCFEHLNAKYNEQKPE